ncbi:MAG: hypothetical protein Q9182_005793 [Xanthomendoza sp. 2 TL-2023]
MAAENKSNLRAFVDEVNVCKQRCEFLWQLLKSRFHVHNPGNELYQTRRGVPKFSFSQKGVLDLEDVVQEKVLILMDHVSKARTSATTLDAHHGFRAVSIDVTTDYAFGESYGLLGQDDLGSEFFMLVQRLGPSAWVFRQ